MPTLPATKLRFFPPFRGNFTAQQIKEHTIEYNQTKSWRMKEKGDATIIWFAQALQGDANIRP